MTWAGFHLASAESSLDPSANKVNQLLTLAQESILKFFFCLIFIIQVMLQLSLFLFLKLLFSASICVHDTRHPVPYLKSLYSQQMQSCNIPKDKMPIQFQVPRLCHDGFRQGNPGMVSFQVVKFELAAPEQPQLCCSEHPWIEGQRHPLCPLSHTLLRALLAFTVIQTANISLHCLQICTLACA